MKLCRFVRSDGSVGWGVQNSAGIQDISKADPTLPTKMVDIIQGWPQLLPRVLGLGKRLEVCEEPLRILCPLDRPRKVLCIGLNYRDHAIETGQAIPGEPMVFCKVPTAVIGPGDDIVLPKVSTQVDFEAELVIVIGTRAKNVDLEGAKKAIFGYTVGHDVSARDWQTGKPGKQYFLGKSFDTFAPLGPAIALAERILDPKNLKIQSRINGETMQDSSTSQLIFSPTELVSYISQVITLDAGDVIFTGTPSGVGLARKPPRFLQPGDVVEIEIESLGILRNPCVAES
ncbi:MAG: fumarylacetoacetate hydrolase family protein [Pirellulaceae bacterium]|nr:fumarylacetoacetate hydrolase family protein [Pirellulaceae bacterium]